jgi:ribonuclease HI
VNRAPNLISMATLYTDGGARGNPGPAGIAYRVLDESGDLLEARSELIGQATNNAAEYRALLAGIAACKRLGIQAVRAFSDSELMVRQLDGSYRVKSGSLGRLVEEARETIDRDFLEVRIEHSPRNDPNLSACDRMVNDVLTSAGFPKQPPPSWVKRAARRRR